MIIIEIEEYQLAALVDATFTALAERLSLIFQDETFREALPLDVVQRNAESHLHLYTQSINKWKEVANWDEDDREWFETRDLPDEMFDYFATFVSARAWSDVPTHYDHDSTDCSLCELINSPTFR